jgi:predicted O-methyltransferase YrrM
VRFPITNRLGLWLRPARRRLKARWLASRGRPEDAVVQLARSVPGWFREAEIRLLYRTVRDLRVPGDIVEIGSWKGRTTVVMGRALADSSSATRRIHAVDPHTGSEEHREAIAREGSTLGAFRRNLRKAGVAAFVDEHVTTSGEAAGTLEAAGVRLALLFVDGAHDEASVRRDLRAFLPRLTPGGLVALHDCEEDGPHPGVWRAYRSELAPRADEVERAESLLVVRPRTAGGSL